MVKRMIVKIDEKKCTGHGKYVAFCAEGAIKIIN
ncbi:ferredoxin [Methanosarcina barkeri CM1]|uniref:Ferredoxin n=1 Tax=Methanosarcina barkeri CM1 TaxID=796385 RepID=A0A0G3CKT3_METBA|nr:ferredoxin [Methanosarcina barkeri CM1]